MLRKLVLALFLAAVVMPFGLGCPDVKMEERMGDKEKTEDVQNYKIKAMSFLEKAKSFEARNPYDYNDQIQRYNDVIRNFPDTMAAREAQQHIQRIKSDPTYRPDR